MRFHTSFKADQHYLSSIDRILKELLPPSPQVPFHELLPLISWTPLSDAPCDLSFYYCSRFRPGGARFFLDMITRWLIPGKRLHPLLQFSIDFSLPEESPLPYIVGEVVVHIETAKELKILASHLPRLEQELRLGIESRYHAARLLEIKGLNNDRKMEMIHENIASLIKRRPQDFDYDLYNEMQHFLLTCKEEFKEARVCTHLTRILCILYLFRKTLQTSLDAFPDRRYISVKIMSAALKESDRQKKVLGIAVGLSFLRENEVFEERHFLNAVQTTLPAVYTVSGSFFAGSGSIRTFYLEVEKEEGMGFTLDEMARLKDELASNIKSRIEERMSPLFMPENEEEIMRHILALSGQVKYVRDLPQAVINFHKQTQEELEFLVVMVRAVTLPTRPLQEIFDTRKTQLKMSPNRTKVVGLLRNKYEKVADVFRVTISKAPFLRQDHSIDLYKARGKVAFEMTKVFGDFRDYNGGIISKESELFSTLKDRLGKTAAEWSFLLENFFYSLTPAVMRSVLPPEPLKKLFYMLIQGEQIPLESTSESHFLIQEDEEYFYLVVAFKDHITRELIEGAIRRQKIPSLQLVTCFVETTEHPCFGLIYRTADREKSLALQLAIEQALNENIKLLL